MGVCWCKEKHNEPYDIYQCTNPNGEVPDSVAAPEIPYSTDSYWDSSEKMCPDSETVDSLVLQTLGVIGTLVDK